MECPICGTSNPHGTESCTQCGSSLIPGGSSWPEGFEGTGRVIKSASRHAPRRRLAEEPPSGRVSALLGALEPDRPEEVRLRAVSQLGELQGSSPEIVQALIAAARQDPATGVRFRAIQSLRSPAHLAVLQAHPELRGAADGAALELVDPGGRMFSRGLVMEGRRKRRKPLSLIWNLAAIVVSAGALVYCVQLVPTMSQGAAWWITWLLAAGALFFLLKFFYELIWPMSSSNLFRVSQQMAAAEVVGKHIREGTSDSEGGRSYNYYVTVQFEAQGKPVVLEARVRRKIYDEVDPGSGMTVRYATRNPQVALLEGE